MAIHTIQSLSPGGNGVMHPSVSPRIGQLGTERRNASVTEGEQVQLTSRTARLRQEIEAPEKESLVNNRVIELKQQIADGTYQVNSAQVARKMVAFEFG